jgi:hypothetical protein
LSSVIKDSYFQSLEQLSTQQRQIQHFNAETARLQVSIQNYMNSSDPALKQQIDRITAELFQELSTIEQHQNDYSTDLHTLHESLKAFINGYQELKAVNLEIDRTYQNELLVPSRRAAELLSIATDKLGGNKKHLLNMSSAVAVDAFIEALLNINAYYANRETTISLNTRASLEQITQLIPLLRSMSANRVEQEAFDALQQQINTMISGLGKLQSSYAKRNSILETKIEGSQRSISRTADILDERYVATEEKLPPRSTQQHGHCHQHLRHHPDFCFQRTRFYLHPHTTRRPPEIGQSLFKWPLRSPCPQGWATRTRPPRCGAEGLPQQCSAAHGRRAGFARQRGTFSRTLGYVQ